MVVLMPVFEGEVERRCSRCGVVGIGSPIPQRSTFYFASRKAGKFESQCRECSKRAAAEYQRANRERRREAVRVYTREYRRRRRADPIERERENAAARARRRNDPNLRARRIEDDRIRRRLVREREGGVLKIAAVNKQARSGIILPIEPFRAVVARMIARAESDGPKARERVAARLGVSARRLHDWLNVWDSVDEAVVDRALSREGSYSLIDVYPDGAATVISERQRKAIEEVTVGRCASPGCGKPRMNSGRFCESHAKRLAKVRAEIEAEEREFRATIGRPGSRPTCCATGCWNARRRGEQYCPECLDVMEGNDEECR